MVILHFCVQFIFHFVLLALNCLCLGALQYWLGYVCKCEASTCKSMCYCFFTRMKQPCTFPMICRNPCATATFKSGNQQLLAVRMANKGTSTLDGDTEQLFGASGPHSYSSHVFLHMRKRLSTLDFDLSSNIMVVFKH